MDRAGAVRAAGHGAAWSDSQTGAPEGCACLASAACRAAERQQRTIYTTRAVRRRHRAGLRQRDLRARWRAQVRRSRHHSHETIMALLSWDDNVIADHSRAQRERRRDGERRSRDGLSPTFESCMAKLPPTDRVSVRRLRNESLKTTTDRLDSEFESRAFLEFLHNAVGIAGTAAIPPDKWQCVRVIHFFLCTVF